MSHACIQLYAPSPDGSRPLHTAAGVPRCGDGTGRHMFIGWLVGFLVVGE